MIPPEPPPSLHLRIDAQALASNWQALDRLSGKGRAGAAVKADAYGIGAVRAVHALQEAGARDFFVAHWREAAALLPAAEGCTLSVLHGPLSGDDIAFARSTGVRAVINSLHQARLWLQGGGGPCHVMVDTGINRLGLALRDLGDPVVQQLEVEVLMSHLASADEDSPQNAVQLDLFQQAGKVVSARTLSLANSAGIALGQDYAFGLTRPGLSLYGGVPRPELARVIRQVVYPQAAIIQLRDLNAGDKVGYNGTFTAPVPMRTATVSIGYADGFLRCRGPDAALHFRGIQLPILGRVSMDMLVVDCGAASALQEGDMIDIPYDLPEISRKTGLSQYELLTLLGRRYSRNGLT